ncbi:hypothetical protein [Sphingomonas beigongshangi]|uniref:hypothetical protein n=1 Tax=Sphingomonas beigongshangi TaxID=2782540 RepID=UPI00193B9B6A|nr:hypothetical protein [Sphingomonas beigongshangi]
MQLRIIIALLSCAALLMVGRSIYNRGVHHERAIWQAKVAAEAAKNAATSAALNAQVQDYAKRLDEALNKRAETVTVYRDRIVNAAYPDCQVTADVMDDRNAIRADPTLP